MYVITRSATCYHEQRDKNRTWCNKRFDGGLKDPKFIPDIPPECFSECSQCQAAKGIKKKREALELAREEFYDAC
jgi:hypothetical protein